jgi:predicted transcriptional regulator
MAKLNTETINKIMAVPRFRSELALRVGLSEQAIIWNLKRNTSNGILTTIDALRCMRDLLNYTNVNQCLDLINNE